MQEGQSKLQMRPDSNPLSQRTEKKGQHISLHQVFVSFEPGATKLRGPLTPSEVEILTPDLLEADVLTPLRTAPCSFQPRDIEMQDVTAL
jgi:hypothetical protein